MKSIVLILLLIFTTLFQNLAAEISLRGTYLGKNIYVQNPLTGDGQEYCTNEVYVNDKLVLSTPKVGAFEIDLSNLSLNSPVEIRIIYKDGCGPKIVNPQVVSFDSDFRFLVCQVNETELRWITERESVAGIYTIEKLVGENWNPIAELDSKGSSINNFYKFSTKHGEGTNIYRIKFTQAEGITLYSKEIAYNREK